MIEVLKNLVPICLCCFTSTKCGELLFVRIIIVNVVAAMSDLKAKNAPNSISAGDLPRSGKRCKLFRVVWGGAYSAPQTP